MTGRDGIGFHIVTGFLGAGKTTLINRLLRGSALADALVIVNEWGEIGLDHLLYETLAGDAVLINSGLRLLRLARRPHRDAARRHGAARLGRLAGFQPDRPRDDGPCRARPDPARARRRPGTVVAARALRRDDARRRGERARDLALAA